MLRPERIFGLGQKVSEAGPGGGAGELDARPSPKAFTYALSPLGAAIRGDVRGGSELTPPQLVGGSLLPLVLW